jgi:hypothetical protein
MVINAASMNSRRPHVIDAFGVTLRPALLLKYHSDGKLSILYNASSPFEQKNLPHSSQSRIEDFGLKISCVGFNRTTG